jgi:hypothetical protein
MEPPKGSSNLWSYPVPMILLLRQKRGEKPGMRRTYFRTGPLPVTWLCHFRSKGPTRADIAQLPVAHAHNILPDRVTSGHVTDVTSGHMTYVTSGHVTSGSTPSNVTLSVPIYYWCGMHKSTWWRLFKNCIVRTKLDIYVFITVHFKSPSSYHQSIFGCIYCCLLHT